MKKLALWMLAGASATIIGLSVAAPSADANKPCARTKFETKLVADACKKGGQAEAKKQMKTFLKTAKKHNADATCNTCHTSLAPKYELTKDGLKLYKQYGGK